MASARRALRPHTRSTTRAASSPARARSSARPTEFSAVPTAASRNQSPPPSDRAPMTGEWLDQLARTLAGAPRRAPVQAETDLAARPRLSRRACFAPALPACSPWRASECSGGRWPRRPPVLAERRCLVSGRIARRLLRKGWTQLPQVHQQLRFPRRSRREVLLLRGVHRRAAVGPPAGRSRCPKKKPPSSSGPPSGTAPPGPHPLPPPPPPPIPTCGHVDCVDGDVCCKAGGEYVCCAIGCARGGSNGCCSSSSDC